MRLVHAMKIIFDKTGNNSRLPLAQLIDRIMVCFNLKPNDGIVLKRIGGSLIGCESAINRYEEVIDCGSELRISLSELRSLAETDNELQILLCEGPSITFGISDGTFMFIQAVDKRAEADVARGFKDVREVMDRSLE